MSARACGRAADGGRGFVLVGVVMLVLALTIIGISLYSLSGYESQFFGRTYADRVTLYRASGGLEMVKKLVTSQIGSPAASRLSNAAFAVGREGIVSAIAWQDNPPDTSGLVDWGDDVHIRVGVSVFGATRTVEGTFTPRDQRSPYHYLFAVPGIIRYGDPGDDLNPPGGRADLVVRGGGSWQNMPPSDTTWKQRVETPYGFITDVGSSPSPASAQFISDHLAGATTPTMTTVPGSPTTNFITLDAGGSHRFFRSPPSDMSASPAERAGYDFVSGYPLHVRVRGTAIWLVPAGMRVDEGVVFERLNSDDAANLVIVAGPSGRYLGEEDVGLNFQRGIEIRTTSRVNVFLVTHGSMKDSEGMNGATDHNIASSLCIFAQHYTMLPGREFGAGNHMERRFRRSMIPIADQLLHDGLLPDPIGGIASGLTLVPGTWTESPGLQ